MGYHKNILVRLIDSESDNEFESILKAYYTSDYSETLKMYQYAKEEEIPIEVPDDEQFGNKRSGDLLFITDIVIAFGSNEHIVCMNIYASGSPV